MPLYSILLLIYFVVLLLFCLLAGWLSVRRSWPLEYKLLLILCSLTFLVEMSTDLLIIRRILYVWLYNLFVPVECGFILFIFYKGSTQRMVKRVNGFLLACLLPGILAAYILHPFLFRFNESAALLYLFSELIAACAVLIGVLMSQSDTPLGHQPLFWMACGVLFYSCIFTVLHAYLNVIPQYAIPKNMAVYYSLYSFIANNFMYAGFIACFFSLRRVGRMVQPAAVS